MKSVLPIAVPATVTTGAALDVTGYDLFSAPVLILGGGTITVQFQESYDGGTTWLSVGAALSATGKANAAFDRSATHVRANTTAASAPTGLSGHCSAHQG
jgi:hypothetical protein